MLGPTEEKKTGETLDWIFQKVFVAIFSNIEKKLHHQIKTIAAQLLKCYKQSCFCTFPKNITKFPPPPPRIIFCKMPFFFFLKHHEILQREK